VVTVSAPDQDWHVGEPLWTAYADGRLDAAAEVSVESHVASCPACRDAARSMVTAATVDAVWRSVQADIARPAPPRAMRWLRRLGVPESELVLLGAADAVTLPWLTAIGGALACALLSGFVGWRQEAVFLGLAPLVPLLAVVAAFDATDSLREVSAATPYSKLRLALIRTTTALAVALPVTLLLGLTIPGLQAIAFSWLLPGLTLSTGALLLLSWLSPWVSGGVLALGWLTAVWVAVGTGGTHLVTGPAAQALLAAVFLLLGGLVALRSTTRALSGAEG
jgi:anti-sigma factor RsiW